MNIQLNNTAKIRKKVRKPDKSPMKMGKALLCSFLLSLVGVLIQSIVQNGFFDWMHFVYVIYPAVVLLNALPIFLIITLFYYSFGKIWIGCIVAYLPLVILNIANYYKTVFRDEPLKVSDLQLVGEMSNITQNYEIKITFSIVIAVIFAIAVTIYAAKRCRTQKINMPVKIIGAMTTVCCMILSYVLIYGNSSIYNGIPTFAEEYHDTSMAQHHGMLYTLLNSSNSTKYKMPEEYTDEYAAQLLSENASAPIATEKNEKINVIAIMGEAFFDVRRGSKVELEEGINPYGNYDEIKELSYHGKLVVPGYGGSTESTEFEFLTGASQYLLDSSMPTAYKTYITQPTYGLVQYFKDNGYSSVAFHPGYPWFYNRKIAYEKLGFDKFVSRDDMSWDTPEFNGYILDSVAAEWIINEYVDHYEANPQTPYFNFTVTIENHGPYTVSENNKKTLYKRPKKMSDENYNIINNYLNGIYDTDMLLGEIFAFAKTREEPVAILFFGDHLPFLDEENECFDALGYSVSHKTDKGLTNKYMVEYLMWCNNAAEEIIGDVKKGEGPTISSNFLGTELLNYLGMEKSPFFNYVEKVQETANVISPKYFMMNGRRVKNFQTGITDDERKILRNYKCLQYYNLRRYAKVDKP